jgi:hypothetical protein
MFSTTSTLTSAPKMPRAWGNYRVVSAKTKEPPNEVTDGREDTMVDQDTLPDLSQKRVPP